MSTDSEVKLYSYWRSSCSFRVRVALKMHNVEYTYIPVNLLKGEQRSEDYTSLSPSGLLPALCIDGLILSESLAIIEYLEETRGRKLLPESPEKRALARRIAFQVAMNIQPVQNLKVLKKIGDKLGEEAKTEWGAQVNMDGMAVLERLLQDSAGKYAVGDEVTIADICLVPQVYNAMRFNVDMNQYPTVKRVYENCMELQAFKDAHPSAQKDAVN